MRSSPFTRISLAPNSAVASRDQADQPAHVTGGGGRKACARMPEKCSRGPILPLVFKDTLYFFSLPQVEKSAAGVSSTSASGLSCLRKANAGVGWATARLLM